MMQQNECSEILELIPDYAFGLTDEATSLRIEAALPTCPEAVRQLDEFRRLQADMRENVALIEPPPTLAFRLGAAIQADAQANPSMSIRSENTRPEPLRAVTPDLSRRRSQATRARADARLFFGLIAAVAVFALIATNIYWFNRVNTTLNEREVLINLIREYRTEWFMVRDSSTLQMASMSADDSAQHAMILWDANAPTGLVALSEFPMLTSGREYQLWLLREQTAPVSGGTLIVDESGFGVMTFTLPEAIESFDAVGITEEPAGGSEAPTMSPLVVGSL